MSLIKYINTNTKKLYNHKTNDALMTSEFVSTVYTLTDERSEHRKSESQNTRRLHQRNVEVIT